MNFYSSICEDTHKHDGGDDTTDDENDEKTQLSSQPSLQISPKAIAIAHSLAKTPLSQICKCLPVANSLMTSCQ